MLQDELLAYLFDRQPHLLAAPMTTWVASSRRFSAFVTAFRSKIRKKLHTTQELESLLDLRLELETAFLLLQERALSVVYEPQPVGKARGPDFAVSYTTSTLFMVEVTRLRATPAHTGAAAAPDPPSRAPISERLADMICSKVGQLLPQRSNVLLVGAADPQLNNDTLRAALLQLQQRAERNDPLIMQRHGFRDRADFFQHYRRLSELLVRSPALSADAPVLSWANPQAQHPLPSKIRTVLYRSQRSANG